LLAVGTVQVTVFQAVPLPDECQRLLGVQRLAPRREVGAGIRVVDGVLQAHVHAAKALGQVVETGQVDLGEVVDGHPGEVSHRLQRRSATCFAAPCFQLFLAARTFVDEFLLDVLFGEAVGFFDLDVVVAGHAGERHPVVAGDRERGHPVVGADMGKDQGVGVVAAVVGVAGVQVLQQGPRQVVPVLVLPRVEPDEQDVHRVAAGLRIVGTQGLRNGDPAQHAVGRPPCRPGRQHREDRHQRPEGMRYAAAPGCYGRSTMAVLSAGSLQVSHHNLDCLRGAALDPWVAVCAGYVQCLTSSMRQVAVRRVGGQVTASSLQGGQLGPLPATMRPSRSPSSTQGSACL
jgi:hypothetical protein